MQLSGVSDGGGLFCCLSKAQGKVCLRPRETFQDIHLILFEKLLVQVVTV